MADGGNAASTALASAVATAAAAATSGVDSQPSCDGDNEYNGQLGVRVSAIFVILVGSLLGMSESKDEVRNGC